MKLCILHFTLHYNIVKNMFEKVQKYKYIFMKIYYTKLHSLQAKCLKLRLISMKILSLE